MSERITIRHLQHELRQLQNAGLAVDVERWNPGDGMTRNLLTNMSGSVYLSRVLSTVEMYEVLRTLNNLMRPVSPESPCLVVRVAKKKGAHLTRGRS